jgi:hypothetical protein
VDAVVVVILLIHFVVLVLDVVDLFDDFAIGVSFFVDRRFGTDLDKSEDEDEGEYVKEYIVLYR